MYPNINCAPLRIRNLSFAAFGTIYLFLFEFHTRADAVEVVGWRNDGQGDFKATESPTQWSREAGVAWKRELPATSLSSPIVVGECALVMAEPSRLLCYRLSDGELLWDRPHEYKDIFGAEKASEIKQRHAESAKLRQEIAELEKKLNTAQAANPGTSDASSLKEKIDDLRQRDMELTVIPPPQVDATGNTASTPVSDGSNVYAVLANGMVSSHRLDGHRNWIRFIDKPMSRHSASPLIVGDLLIVHFNQLVALDTQTGEVVWKADTAARNGTPISATVGDRQVIITPAGAIVGIADGTVLAKDLFNLAYSSPIAHQGVVFAAEKGKITAIQLSAANAANAVQSKVLWESKAAQEDHLASPVIHGDLLFAATGTGILQVVDLAKGNVIKRKRLELGDGRVDASLAIANGRLYVQSTNGTTAILEPSQDCPEVARNKSDGSSSTPFFVGERILFRTPTHLICIGGASN